MRTLKLFNPGLFVLAITILLAACGNASQNSAEATENEAQEVLVQDEEQGDLLPDYTASTSEEFQQQIAGLVQQYLAIKDALVASDQAQAQTAAGLFMDQLKDVDMSLLAGESHTYWMEQLNTLQGNGANIKSNDSLEEQRKEFDTLSQALIKTVKVYGTPEATYYVQHCPMAFNNTGANWLSNEEQVLNPYFGDQMLRCGFVEETIN